MFFHILGSYSLLAEVITLFKKADPLDKKSIDLLVYCRTCLKFLKRIIFKQIIKYIEQFLSNLLTGFCKNQNTQHCLLKMLEK